MVMSGVPADGASSAIIAASNDGDTSSIANALSLSFAFGYAVPAARATAQAIQAGSAFTCSNSAAAAYISALSNAIAIGNTEAAAQAVFAAFTLGWYASQTHPRSTQDELVHCVTMSCCISIMHDAFRDDGCTLT